MKLLRLVMALALAAPILVRASALAAQERNAPACFPQRYDELRKIPEASRTHEQQQEFEQLQRACAAVGAAAVSAQGARATATPTPTMPAVSPAAVHLRHGFWFTGGLGYSSLGCETCGGDRTNGVAVNIGLGGTLSQHVQLGGGIHGWSKTEQDLTLTASAASALIRVYPSARGRFFLAGGLGAGTVSAHVNSWSGTSDAAFAAVLGLGYDARIGRNVSLTPFFNSVGMAGEGWNVNFTQLGLAVTTY